MPEADDGRFERLMRGLQFERSAYDPEEGSGDAFLRARTLLARLDVKIEDLQPWHGIIETRSTIYKVLEAGADYDSLYEDVARAGAEAFAKSKHFTMYAPALANDIAYRIQALGHADFFARANLRAILCVSDMQFARALQVHDGDVASRAHHERGDSFYWGAAAKALGWIVACIALYTFIRHRVPNAYYDVSALLPCWAKAFYGTRFLRTDDLRNPLTRIIMTNNVVTPVYAVLLASTIAFAPSGIPAIAATALLVDGVSFFFEPLARRVARFGATLPAILR